MAHELKNLVFALALFVLFSIMTLSFFVGIADTYDRDISTVAGGSLNVSLFDDARTNITRESASISSRYKSSEQAESDSDQEPTGTWSTIKSLGNMAVYPFLVLGNVGENVLGIPTEFMLVIEALITLSLFFGGWAMWKAGS